MFFPKRASFLKFISLSDPAFFYQGKQVKLKLVIWQNLRNYKELVTFSCHLLGYAFFWNFVCSDSPRFDGRCFHNDYRKAVLSCVPIHLYFLNFFSQLKEMKEKSGFLNGMSVSVSTMSYEEEPFVRFLV